jgi:hypothetical protein
LAVLKADGPFVNGRLQGLLLFIGDLQPAGEEFPAFATRRFVGSIAAEAQEGAGPLFNHPGEGK